MDEERVVEEIVTKFLLNTCRLSPRLTKPAAEAAVRCAEVAAHKPPDDDKEVDLIPLTVSQVLCE